VFPEKKDIECFAFAPPPVVSEELAKNAQPFIYSFVHRRDIVPLLSLGSVTDLFFQCRSIVSQFDSRTSSILHLIFKGDKSKEFIRKFLNHLPEIEYKENISQSPKLHLSGKVFHIDTMLNNNSYIIQRRASDNFLSIEIANEMLSDHFPDKYERALDTFTGRYDDQIDKRK
jgi:hypothetical protein